MNLRLAMPVRIGLIMMIALFAGWITLLAAFYISTDGGRQAALPTPERLVALAKVFEQRPSDDRSLLIGALTARDFQVRLTEGKPDLTATPEFNPLDAATFEAITEQLAPRDVAILPQIIEGLPGSVFVSPINAVEFQIALRSGETLVVTTNSPIVVASIGLPVGFGAALVGTVIALVMLIVLHREFRPLSRLAAAVDAVDPMGEPADLPPIRARSPELRALIAAFARLQDRLGVLIKGRMALIGGLQHDVRTFATRLRLRVDKIADPAERERATADIQDMIHLLDDALLASRAGANELDEELIDFSALIRSEIADRREQGAPVELAMSPSADQATVLGDRLALRRVIANLIDNALTYGNSAQLDLVYAPDEIILTIDDDGPGIRVEQREMLLEPFTRLEASRARHTGGSGLGLAVASGLVQAHLGKLVISDSPTGGTRILIRLPVFRSGPSSAQYT